MVTTVSGKHMEVGAALQKYVHDRIDLGVKKYLYDITQAKIVFSKNSYLYHTDIMIHDAHMGLIKAECESDDVYASFDNAVVKIEKQLRKYKGRIKKHIHTRSLKEIDNTSASGVKYILNMPAIPEHHDDHDHDHDHEPVTIAEKAVNIERLTVSEAIMKMDLAHLPALMFTNKLNNRINMVYHRSDGNISWVDPDEKSKI
jgi:ribosomal subunit interface protein